MKQLLSSLLFIGMWGSLIAQIPQNFSYQALANGTTHISQGIDAHGDEVGLLYFNTSSGIHKIGQGIGGGNAEFSVLRCPNGHMNVIQGVSNNNTPDRDDLTIWDEYGNTQISLLIDGNGVIKAGGEIAYVFLESTEAVLYERGTIELVNGEAEIRFSERFGIDANPNTMTVFLTPESGDSRSLAVIELSTGGFKIKELLGGTSSFLIDWEVKAVHKN